MKGAYLLLPLAALSLGQAVFAFSGCGSTTETSDGGSKCDAPCDDALSDEMKPDVATEDVEGSDAGSSCDAACAKQVDFPGCPYPGCTAECQRQSTACFLALHPAAYADLLGCEATAHYVCGPTDSGTLPTTTDCDDAAAAVASDCKPPPDASMMFDAGSCAAQMTPALCQQCCGEMFTDGLDTYNLALTSCACDSPGTCAGPCATSFCMSTAPDAGDPCSKCLAKTTGPDGGCAAEITTQCDLDPGCVSYEGCLTMNKCASIK